MDKGLFNKLAKMGAMGLVMTSSAFAKPTPTQVEKVETVIEKIEEAEETASFILENDKKSTNDVELTQWGNYWSNWNNWNNWRNFGNWGNFW